MSLETGSTAPLATNTFENHLLPAYIATSPVAEGAKKTAIFFKNNMRPIIRLTALVATVVVIKKIKADDLNSYVQAISFLFLGIVLTVDEICEKRFYQRNPSFQKAQEIKTRSDSISSFSIFSKSMGIDPKHIYTTEKTHRSLIRDELLTGKWIKKLDSRLALKMMQAIAIACLCIPGIREEAINIIRPYTPLAIGISGGFVIRNVSEIFLFKK